MVFNREQAAMNTKPDPQKIARLSNSKRWLFDDQSLKELEYRLLCEGLHSLETAGRLEDIGNRYLDLSEQIRALCLRDAE